MLGKQPDPTQDSLDATITELMNDMKTHDGDSEEYATCMNRLERLMKLKEKNSPKRVNPDTWILVGGNLVGILIVVGYERGHVIATRALSQVIKPR